MGGRHSLIWGGVDRGLLGEKDTTKHYKQLDWYVDICVITSAKIYIKKILKKQSTNPSHKQTDKKF